MNDFNKQKQEIIDFIDLHTHRLVGDGLSLGGSHRYTITAGNYGVLIDKIDSLQPPKLTCSTCKYCIQTKQNCGDGIIAEHYNCISDNVSWDMLPYIEEPSNFGCIHHSDYEVKDA